MTSQRREYYTIEVLPVPSLGKYVLVLSNIQVIQYQVQTWLTLGCSLIRYTGPRGCGSSHHTLEHL